MEALGAARLDGVWAQVARLAGAEGAALLGATSKAWHGRIARAVATVDFAARGVPLSAVVGPRVADRAVALLRYFHRGEACATCEAPRCRVGWGAITGHAAERDHMGRLIDIPDHVNRDIYAGVCAPCGEEGVWAYSTTSEAMVREIDVHYGLHAYSTLFRLPMPVLRRGNPGFGPIRRLRTVFHTQWEESGTKVEALSRVTRAFDGAFGMEHLVFGMRTNLGMWALALMSGVLTGLVRVLVHGVIPGFTHFGTVRWFGTTAFVQCIVAHLAHHSSWLVLVLVPATFNRAWATLRRPALLPLVTQGEATVASEVQAFGSRLAAIAFHLAFFGTLCRNADRWPDMLVSVMVTSAVAAAAIGLMLLGTGRSGRCGDLARAFLRLVVGLAVAIPFFAALSAAATWQWDAHRVAEPTDALRAGPWTDGAVPSWPPPSQAGALVLFVLFVLWGVCSLQTRYVVYAYRFCGHLYPHHFALRFLAGLQVLILHRTQCAPDTLVVFSDMDFWVRGAGAAASCAFLVLVWRAYGAPPAGAARQWYDWAREVGCSAALLLLAWVPTGMVAGTCEQLLRLTCVAAALLLPWRTDHGMAQPCPRPALVPWARAAALAAAACAIAAHRAAPF